MSNKKLEKQLEKNLEALYQKYTLRLNKLKERKLSVSEALGMIAGLAGVGAALGTPVPGIGNALGAATGVIVGSVVAVSLAADYDRKNKKLANANEVLNLLNQDSIQYKKIFSAAAKQIAKDRAAMLANCNIKDISIGAKLLARDAMAGLKKLYKYQTKATKNELIQSLTNAALNGESKKASMVRLIYKQGLFATPVTKENLIVPEDNCLSKKYA